MGQGHFSRPGHWSAADETGIGNGVVGAAEGPTGDQRLAARKQTDDGMDLGGFQGFVEALGGEDGRQAPGQHGLAAARRPDEQQVVIAGGSHFESTLDMLLAAHLGEICFRNGGLLEDFGDIHPAGRQLLGAVEKIHQLAQVADAVDRHAVHQGRFAGVLLRQHQPGNRPLPGRGRQRQGAADGLDAAIQGQLAEKHQGRFMARLDDPGGGENAHRHGQVEGGAVLLDVGGRQIDGDAPHRELVARVADSRLDPVLAFLDRPLGQADGGKLRQPLADVHLDLNGIGVDAEQGAGQNPG